VLAWGSLGNNRCRVSAMAHHACAPFQMISMHKLCHLISFAAWKLHHLRLLPLSALSRRVFRNLALPFSSPHTSSRATTPPSSTVNHHPRSSVIAVSDGSLDLDYLDLDYLCLDSHREISLVRYIGERTNECTRWGASTAKVSGAGVMTEVDRCR